jgi:hypothetical protein
MNNGVMNEVEEQVVAICQLSFDICATVLSTSNKEPTVSLQLPNSRELEKVVPSSKSGELGKIQIMIVNFSEYNATTTTKHRSNHDDLAKYHMDPFCIISFSKSCIL